MMDQNDQNDRFDRFDRFEPDFSRFESASDRSERSSSLDHSERPARTGRRQSARPVRSGMRMGKGKPMRRASVKLNYRMVLCIAVLVLLLLTIIFGGLFKSRGSKIADLNSQIETLNKDKDNLSAQIGALTQENQTLQSSITTSAFRRAICRTSWASTAMTLPAMLPPPAMHRSASTMCCSPTA